jgi:phosphoribosylanthranilate isomerase
MRTVKVKICGITRKEDLDAAAVAGADAVGFVVGTTASPRNISLEKAEKLVRHVPPFVKSVLVTVPTSFDELTEAYEKLNPDIIQLHRENLPDAASVRLKFPNTCLIGAVQANPANALDVASRASKVFDAVLLDSFVNGKYGGTGIVHDWELSKRVKQVIHPKPLILAGGLNPENVAEAVRVVQPYAVDVSSGVELQPGIKDLQKMVNFIKNVEDTRT